MMDERLHVTNSIINDDIIETKVPCVNYDNKIAENNFPGRFVLSMQDIDVSAESIKSALRDCDARRKSIEAEMEEIQITLCSPAFLGVGIQKPLIDNDGFPISGLDLHEVRARRNRFALLATDLKDLEAQLAELLHRLHENARQSGTIEKGERRSLWPFGKVSEVVAGSAAEKAGLLVGDRIVRFGHLSATTEQGVETCYDSIPSVVQNFPIDQKLEIQVVRLGRDQDEIVLWVDLTASRLGCLIKKV